MVQKLWQYIRWFIVMGLIPFGLLFALTGLLMDHQTTLFIVGPAFLIIYFLVIFKKRARIDLADYAILIWNVRRNRTGRLSIFMGWIRVLSWLFIAPSVGFILLVRGINGKALSILPEPMYLITLGTLLIIASGLIWTIHLLYLVSRRRATLS